VGLALTFHSQVGAAADGARTKALLDALSTDPVWSDDGPTLSSHTKLAVELGEPAIQALTNRLGSATGDESQRTANAIAYIGGPRAVQVLRNDALRSPSASTKALLAFAVPSAPSQELRQTLIGYLKGPHIGSTWFPIVQSAYSLGIMRDRSAITALHAAATVPGGYGTFASTAAQQALDWIGGTNPTIAFALKGPSDDLLEAIIAAGLPGLSRSSSWCERSSPSRAWHKTGEAWTVESGCASRAETPEMSVDSYRSSDGKRAVVAIGFRLGPKDGIGYNYVLRHEGDHWLVVGLQPMWVS
jgi:hypothetical protein